MTRIIAGRFGGRRLEVPAKGTRPTSDRVREALFSRLEHLGVVAYANVLDLYAGSGALGLEAASRGAARVTLVDAAKAAVVVAQKNVRALGLRSEQATVVQDDALRYASRIDQAFDLVFLDPPYDLPAPQLAAVLAELARPGVLASDAIVVVEQASRSAAPKLPDRLVEFDAKKYGETVVRFVEPEPDVGH